MRDYFDTIVGTMKYITIFLLLTLISCKNKTNTDSITETETIIKTESKVETEIEDGIDETVYEMWDSFTASNPEFKSEAVPDSDSFHNNEYDANRLADLIVNGKKKAGSSLYFWFKEANADLPKIGTKTIVTNFDGKARAIIEITKVDTIPFNKIQKDYAELDMGTTIEPLKKWKKAHWEFFESALGQSGDKPTEEMLVVCQWFDTIWPE